MAAGDLRERFAFDRRSTQGDGAGNFEDDWVEVVAPVPARMFFRVGTEAVLAERLAGRQPVEITVRSCAATRLVTTDFRARDARTSATYDIKAVTPGERRDLIRILCEAGGGDG